MRGLSVFVVVHPGDPAVGAGERDLLNKGSEVISSFWSDRLKGRKRGRKFSSAAKALCAFIPWKGPGVYQCTDVSLQRSTERWSRVR